MRGKADTLKALTVQRRIAPAYAGKSNTFFIFWCTQEDHPRLCGEKWGMSESIAPGAGSPPPMRGKVRGSMYCVLLQGITPAYAGKSGACAIYRRSDRDHPRLCGEKGYVDGGTACRRDHPRLCGEKSLERMPHTVLSGSPPPMRGKGVRRGKWQNAYRITPAYAGKSLRAFFHFVFPKDHPRLCGEKFIHSCHPLSMM